MCTLVSLRPVRLARARALTDQQDVEGAAAKSFFPDGDEALAEFESEAKSKVEELGKLLADREEEFYSYQNAMPAEDDDYDDEDDAPSGDAAKKPNIDTIDYADDEDEDDAGKDEM